MVAFTDPLLRILRSTGDLFHDCLTIVDINDPHRPCLYVNEQFTVQTGYSSSDTIGKNLSFLQGPLTNPKTTRMMQKAFVEQEAICVDIINYRKSQEAFLNRLVMLPLKRNEAVYYVGFQNAISESEAANSQQTVSSRQIQNNLSNLLSHVTLRVSGPDIDERLQIARDLANTFERINTFCLTLTSTTVTS